VIERVVDIAGREVHIDGDRADGYVEQLPDHIQEAALDCASILLSDDSVIIDVGANVGVLAIGFAQLVPRGRVVAIEPSPRAFPYLVRNLEAAGASQVDTLQVAASDGVGTLEFFDNDWFSAGSFVKSPSPASDLEIHTASTKVAAEPIDAIVERLGLASVDFIKIDVEGHEIQALDGARTTLERFEPTAVIESNLFTTTCFGNTLPFDFLMAIRGAFPYVYDFDRSDGVWPMVGEQDMYGIIHRQFMSGRPSELICRFEPLPDEAQAELARRTTPSALAAAQQHLAAVLREEQQLRERLDETSAALDAATEENRALRASTSWKVTAPLRRMSDRLRRTG
jgi:FkbM family methyltransferase